MPSMAEILENPNRAEVSSYDPTWRDRAAMKLRELLGADQGPMSPETERLVSGLTGSTGLNSSPSSIFDLAGLAALGPVGGAAAALPAGMALTDAADYAGQGEAGKATMSALLGGLNAAAVPGVGQAVSNMPKLSTMLAAGGLGLVGGSSEAGSAEESAEVNRLQQLYSQQADLNRRRSEAEAEANAEARTGKGPNWQRAAAKVQAIDTEMAGLNRLIAEEQKRNSPEFQMELEQKRKDAERAEAARNANTPFRERYPDLAAALPVAGTALAAGIPFLLKAKGNLGSFLPGSYAGQIRRGISETEKAIEAGNATTTALRARELETLAANQPTVGGELGKTAMAGASGGILSAEAGMFPDQYDGIFGGLPEGPERDKARARALDLGAFAERAGMGAVTGASGYKAGDLLPKSRPQIERALSLSGILKGGFGDDVVAVSSNLAPRSPAVSPKAPVRHWEGQPRSPDGRWVTPKKSP
jgi:hypothetical protein